MKKARIYKRDGCWWYEDEWNLKPFGSWHHAVAYAHAFLGGDYSLCEQRAQEIIAATWQKWFPNLYYS